MTVSIAADSPLAERIACSPAEAARALGISRAKLYQLLKEGTLGATKLGHRTLISVSELKQFHSDLPKRDCLHNSSIGARTHGR